MRNAVRRASHRGIGAGSLRIVCVEVVHLVFVEQREIEQALRVIVCGTERLAAGATLVQGYSEFIYRGPLWARSINRGLDRMPVPSTEGGRG